MDDEMMHNLINFYKFREDVFWIDLEDSKIYFGKFSYTNPKARLDKHGRTSLDLVRNNVTHSLMNCSTRTVLYNLMFMSYEQLLQEMNFVLILIDSNKNNQDHALRSLVSIFNCIYFVIRQCSQKHISNAEKKTQSDQIATHMETYNLCPCVPPHKGANWQDVDYKLMLHDLPDQFYRDTNERGDTEPVPPPPPQTTNAALNTFFVRN
jgi:hypothetical protein